MLKLSYIIPAYNASAYIRRTLDAIFSLPLPKDEYEVIVIDDCSTDNTIEIVEAYSRPLPKGKGAQNLKLLKQPKNNRQGAARNRGIEIARGEYIAFCDADDSIVAEGVLSALQAVETSHADICYFDFEYEQSNGQWIRFEMPKETHNTILSAEEYLDRYYTCAYNAPWRCLYRTEFLLSIGIRFEEGVRWEDCDWTVKVYEQAGKIQFVDGVGYRYGWNESATSRQRTPHAVAERVYAGLRLSEHAEQIKSLLPGLSHTLSDEGYDYYIHPEIKLRALTKRSFRDNTYICQEEMHRDRLIRYVRGIWEKLYVQHRYVSLTILFFACPLAAVGRKMVAVLRQPKMV